MLRESVPVALLAPAVCFPPQLLGAWAAVVFGGCGGGLYGCGSVCLKVNNQERPVCVAVVAVAAAAAAVLQCACKGCFTFLLCGEGAG